MTLKKKKHTNNDEVEFSQILDECMISELSYQNSAKLVEQLSLYNFSLEERKRITKDALFISANKEPVAEYNLRKLKEMSSRNNPVAVIRSSTRRGNGKGKNSHFGEQVPMTTLLCINALVALTGYNIYPRWGLHNGALGYVVAIVFRDGETPNGGHLPAYVIVNFPSYVGPPWDKSNPKVCSEIICYIIYNVISCMKL